MAGSKYSALPALRVRRTAPFCSRRCTIVCTVVYAGRSARSMASCTSRTVASPRRQSTLMTSVSNFVSAMRSLDMRAYYICSSALSTGEGSAGTTPALPRFKSLLACFLIELHPLALHFHLGLVANLVLADAGEDIVHIHRRAAAVRRACERHLVAGPAGGLLGRIAAHIVDGAGDERLRLRVVAQQHAHRVRVRVLRSLGLGIANLHP